MLAVAVVVWEDGRLLCWPVYCVVEILQNSAPYFLIFVLVVCSPLLFLAGRTTGYFAGQSTAVVEILQSSAPGLAMVMMMVGNAAVAATATAANRTAVLMRTTSYFAGESTAVVEILQSSAPGQQAEAAYLLCQCIIS